MLLLLWTLFKERNSFFQLGLPKGCKAYGSRASKVNIRRCMNIWHEIGGDLDFILILAGSKTSEVKGISAAGLTPSSRRYTALADAEFLLKGPLKKLKWDLPKLNAGFSPALISYVGSKFLNINPLIISVGLFNEPTFQHINFETPSQGPAECLKNGNAMKFDRVRFLWEEAVSMGKEMTQPLLLAECVPGGTTTAQAVMNGLGISVEDLMGSSIINPPIDLKRNLVEEGLRNADLGENPLSQNVIAAVGDPFQPVAVGLILGAREVGLQVLLGGGTQMIAILSLALRAIKPSKRSYFLSGVSIATTAWLAEDRQLLTNGDRSSFERLINLVEKHFNVEILAFSSGLKFINSTKKELKDYEKGYVKEGVGAGAISFLAQVNGVSCSQLVNACELAIDQFYSIKCK